MSDPTPLREAIAAVLSSLEPDWPQGKCLNRADAILAVLVEHRVQVLAALGMDPDGHPTGPLWCRVVGIPLKAKDCPLCTYAAALNKEEE